MLGGASQAQQGVAPQQVLEQTLIHQQQVLETLLKQHEAQRQVLHSAIQAAAAANPVNNRAIQSLQQQLTTLQQKQDVEKQALANRQRQESDALRAGINQPAGGQNPAAPQDPVGEVPTIVTADVAGMLLDPTTLPTPVVVDRAFNELGNLNDVVFQDTAAVIQLGKALFWDVQVGSDNKTACATCHNFGGADWRNRNQLASGGNQDITLGDFMKNPEGRLDGILGSQGVIQNHYVGVDAPGADLGNSPSVAELAEQFTLNGTVESRTRQVTGRNAPSVINAAFYSRQFWDGRASRFFNGENIFGASDPDAGVWENHGGSLIKNNDFLVDYASLAAQAMGPAGNGVEMAHGPDGARDFHEIGMKLLDSSIRPLGLQKVDANDSVLATLVAADGVGLSATYADLVRQAFKPIYWNFEGGDVSGYTQMELNFGMFFGLAIQEYERTLISDQSRFDDFAKGDQDALTFDEKKGLNLFMAEGTACTACHSGGVFSEARWDVTLADPIENSGSDVIETAWANIGVSAQDSDLGVGRMDLPFGAISLAKLAAGETNNKTIVPGDQQWPGLPSAAGLPVLVDGAFKIPGLRNIELSAPYFHTGGYSTLEDVVKFYSRGGDFPENPHLDGDIHPIVELESKPEKIAQLAAFLRSLTDDRVRHRSAPFDHPELPVPNGHNPGPSGVALDNIVVVPATGAEGTASVFPMFSDRIGATDPKSGVLDFVAEAAGQTPTSATADQAARAADARRNQLNQLVNQLQAQLNAETQDVNNRLNAGLLTPQQQNAALIDIDQRRVARMRELSNMMALVNAGLDVDIPGVVTPPVTPPVTPVTPPVDPVVTPPVTPVTPPVTPVTPPVDPVVTPPVTPLTPPVDPVVTPPVTPVTPPVDPVVTPPVTPVTPPVDPVVTPPVTPLTPPVDPVVTPPVTPVTPPVDPVVTPPVTPVTPPVVTPPVVFNPGNVPLVGNLVAGPAESLVGPVSGTLIVSDRRPLRSRTNVTIIDVPVGSFSNNNGFFNGGVVPADLATTLSGLTVEYLDANGNVIAVSQQFVTESAGIPGLVTISMSVRDPAELAFLDAATQVRVLQSEPTALAVRVLATVGYPDGTAVIAVP